MKIYGEIDSMLPPGCSERDGEFDMPSGEVDYERKTLRTTMIPKTTYTSTNVDLDEVKTWVFTFGYEHVHPVTGASLANSFVQIEGTLNGAREVMARNFGTKWSMQYPGISEAGVHKYGLREIELPELEVA